ncbi:MAG: hypothetical protein ACUVUS_08210 [Thermoproteota archaeon]
MEEEYIIPTDVKRYVYCPKIIYISRVLHLEERTTDYMEAEKAAKRASLKYFWQRGCDNNRL